MVTIGLRDNVPSIGEQLMPTANKYCATEFYKQPCQRSMKKTEIKNTQTHNWYASGAMPTVKKWLCI